MERATTATTHEQLRKAEAKAPEEKTKVVPTTKRSSTSSSTSSSSNRNRWFFSFNGWTGTQSGLDDDFVLA